MVLSRGYESLDMDSSKKGFNFFATGPVFWPGGVNIVLSHGDKSTFYFCVDMWDLAWRQGYLRLGPFPRNKFIGSWMTFEERACYM